MSKDFNYENILSSNTEDPVHFKIKFQVLWLLNIVTEKSASVVQDKSW